MSDDTNSGDANKGPEGQEDTSKQAEAPKVDVSALENQIAKLTKDLENARKGEKFNKQTKEELAKRVEELEAQGDWKSKYEQAEERLKTLALDGALTEAAKAAKAKDIKAVLKLVDRSELVVKDGVVDTKAVDAAITKAKQEFGLLFEAVELPPSGRAVEGDVTGGFNKEIYAAKTEKEILAVMKKYNKA